MWHTLPVFGTAILLCTMIMASYTFATALAAGASGRIRTLQAARLGTYGTVGLIAVAVVCLAYAFVSHDFRIRYVTHYSDRGMPLPYLFTALWGGQDGSLLWWLFLLSVYIGCTVKWLGRRYLELQPYILATLMVVVIFFCLLMAFAANPFGVSVGGARPDGEGLNPLLQNFYMIIHPPSLYIGFVGCTIPFAFAIAALASGRLDHEWIVASRKWMLFAWLFLAIGNTLGMLWAYEELGWGGYWAWDPVENAAFMPFLAASAYVHSVMIQERRGLLKVWNIFLICLVFFMTIFGTFLTRSGSIASVHSFAQSGIGTYFVWFLGFLVAATATLIFYRWPELRSLTLPDGSPLDRATLKRLRRAALITGWVMILGCTPGLFLLMDTFIADNTVRVAVFAGVIGLIEYGALELVYRRMTRGLQITHAAPQIESFWSREFTFVLNNWALLGFMTFVLVATTFPMISEALWNEKVTVGPPYYNAWVQPLGLIIFVLMGIGTLFGWKKTSPQALRRNIIAPASAWALAVVLHVTLGPVIGYPAIVKTPPIYSGLMGDVLQGFNAITPVLGFSLCAFNAAVIIQEFVLLYRARSRTKAGTLPVFVPMLLPVTSRRRYGGYIVHFGIVLMFFGFTGKSWTVDKETSLQPGQTFQVQDYKLEYLGPRMEVDNTKRMVFADLRVFRGGKSLGDVHPAKFIYKKMPESPTTEIAKLVSLRDDLYVVVGAINPQTKVANFQIHVNPLVVWIWFGCLVLMMGSVVCMWPELAPEESRVWHFARGGATVAASTTLGVMLALMPVPAHAQTSSTHAGTVHIENEFEREVFSAVRCMCGGCQRLPLTECACTEAASSRDEIRKQIERGMNKQQIFDAYAAAYGGAALNLPPNRGAMKSIYALPLVAIFGGGLLVITRLKRWRRTSDAEATAATTATGRSVKKDDYDTRLDDELKDLDD